jgi:hypothetical protein
MIRDRMLETFLRNQREEGLALSAASDLLELTPLDDGSASRYVARFWCTGLVRPRGGEIHEAAPFDVGIWFPPDYLRRAEPWQVLTWLGPREAFHPNISRRFPLICVGRIHRGMPLVDLLYQCYEVITYQKVTMREDDALNLEACAWARDNQHRFPIDRRPLKWRRPPAPGGRDPGVSQPAGGEP